MSKPKASDVSELIERYIEVPTAPVLRSEPVVKGKGVPVWAIVGYLKVVSKSAQFTLITSLGRLLEPVLNKLLMASFKRVAEEYGLETDEVRAAWSYYLLNREEIEAKLNRNRDAVA